MKAAALVLLLCTASLLATNAQGQSSQTLRKGAWDLGLWTSGGFSASGGIGDTNLFNAGFRVGKILTNEHGRSWYRGNLEAAADVIPVTLVFQETVRPLICIQIFPPPCVPTRRDETVYGGGFNPLLTRWNFTAPRRFAPYVELGGGLLFTTSDVPAFTSNINFTPQFAIGTHIFTRERRSVSIDTRYVHISNAGLSSLNPGINTVQFSLGYHWFR
jgi:lipid A 3-O-deacylase